MSDKVAIHVFDGPEMTGCAGCAGCSAGGIGVKAATEQMAVKLNAIYNDVVEVIYIDTAEKGLTDYPEVAEVISRGYSFPVISLNGLPRLAGALNVEDVKEIIEEHLKN